MVTPITDPEVCIEMKSVLIALRAVKEGLLDDQLDEKAKARLLKELNAYAVSIIEADMRAQPETYVEHPDGSFSLAH
jgi:hypothetical protein